MSEIVNTVDSSILENVVVNNDLSKLSSAQRFEYLQGLCKSLNLNILSRPFQYIMLNGKLTLYATRDATDQLRKMNEISISVTDRKLYEDVYIVHVKATTPSGRTDEATGAVPLNRNMSPADKANAYMKAETKAKRRATLSICGLGMLDETEIETIRGAVPVDDNIKPVPIIDHVAEMKEYLNRVAPTSEEKKAFVDSCEKASENWREVLEEARDEGVLSPDEFVTWYGERFSYDDDPYSNKAVI